MNILRGLSTLAGLWLLLSAQILLMVSVLFLIVGLVIDMGRFPAADLVKFSLIASAGIMIFMWIQDRLGRRSAPLDL